MHASLLYLIISLNVVLMLCGGKSFHKLRRHYDKVGVDENDTPYFVSLLVIDERSFLVFYLVAAHIIKCCEGASSSFLERLQLNP